MSADCTVHPVSYNTPISVVSNNFNRPERIEGVMLITKNVTLLSCHIQFTFPRAESERFRFKGKKRVTVSTEIDVHLNDLKFSPRSQLTQTKGVRKCRQSAIDQTARPTFKLAGHKTMSNRTFDVKTVASESVPASSCRYARIVLALGLPPVSWCIITKCIFSR